MDINLDRAQAPAQAALGRRHQTDLATAWPERGVQAEFDTWLRMSSTNRDRPSVRSP